MERAETKANVRKECHRVAVTGKAGDEWMMDRGKERNSVGERGGERREEISTHTCSAQ